MSEPSLPMRLYKHLYPLPPLHRPRSKPMRVLCLGLPRSGTESLRHALFAMGYSHVYHGFDAVHNPAESIVWLELRDKQLRGHTLTAADFDRVLGHCEAVTELPCCIFAQELIAAYPHAKVIINVRDDIDAWHASVIKTWSKGEGGLGGRLAFWTLSWFRSQIFWIARQHVAITEGAFLTSDYRTNAKAFYRSHYEMLSALAVRNPDRYLTWRVLDGWGPLCNFLDKPLPTDPFPHAHAQDGAADKAVRLIMPHCYVAIANLVLSIVIPCFILWLVFSGAR